MSIYQTFINMMNDDIRSAFESKNPFVFKYIQHTTSASVFEDVGKATMVIMEADKAGRSPMDLTILLGTWAWW